jgi:acyl-coenzyme A thioesterase PaaI-like protein
MHGAALRQKMDDGDRMRVPDDAKTSQRLRNVHGRCFMTFADHCLLAFAPCRC